MSEQMMTGKPTTAHVPSIELLGCPFCGNIDGVGVHNYNDAVGINDEEEPDGYLVVCNVNKGGCGSGSGFSQTKSDAINKWNTRKPNAEISGRKGG